MGWDVKATADAVGEVLPAIPKHLSDLTMQQAASAIAMVVFGFVLLAVLWRLGPRVWKTVEEAMFSNWRLALLGATGIALSLASGYTTWDGMRNFTGEGLLSLLITFGIQGVMLIIAWLIGESFATGMSQPVAGGGVSKRTQAFAGMVAGLVITLALGALAIFWSSSLFEHGDKTLFAILGAGILVLVVAFQWDVVQPYLQSSRVIAKNSVLWVMFLACMATSVFFSFDSLFSAIFPQDQRVRAAELRAQNQVAGIVADIGKTIETRRLTAAKQLFDDDGWRVYEGELDKLAAASRGSEGEIEKYYVQKMEERRAAIAEQHERIATSESGQAGLTVKKAALTDELSRLESERPALATDLAQKKSELDQRAKEVDAKRVEAMAEDKGVEGTLKEGRGPVYRQRMAELGKLQDYYKIGEQRVKDAQKRVDETSTKIDRLKRELAEIDASLAKLQGEADTAQQRIAVSEATPAETTEPVVDPSRVLPAFELARTDFRQEPNEERLTKVQQQCTQLLNAMASTPTTKEKVKGIDCDPKRAVEAATILFALNSGSRAFSGNCAGGEKLAEHNSADSLFGFARKCLADSGLPSKETDKLRTKINIMELNRDDKAHRFVVTWNAFQDGNRLAYLALAIALAIDSLVFMSGLFGANAVRSPLSDVPTLKTRSARQLDAIIENALLPDTFDSARMVLQSMRPITNERGYMAEVRVDRLDPHTAGRVLEVLNAGSTINAVAYDAVHDRYLVRSELFEFLSVAAKKAFEKSEHHVNLAELEKIIGVALLPDLAANAETVLAYMHPIQETPTLLERLGLKGPHGFMAELLMDEVQEDDRRVVRSALNAGATMKSVQRGDVNHYFVTGDFYRTLARIRARSLFIGGTARQLAGGTDRKSVDGGSLTTPAAAIAHQPVVPPPLPGVDAQIDALKDELRLAFLRVIGLDYAAYHAVSRPDYISSAIKAGKSLEQLKDANSVLGHELRLKDKEVRDSLRHVYQALWSRNSGDERQIEALNSVNEEIEALLPALMLSPRGPYEQVLWRLIDELERAAAPDDGLDEKQQVLLDRLRSHASDLALVKRDSPEAWQKVGELVFRWEDSDSSQVRIANA